MNYILESIIVGVYSSMIFLIISNFIKNIYLLFFLTGFIKHLFGYLLNIHTLYCNYGYACSNKDKNKDNNKIAIYSNYLWIESIVEGLLYLLIGLLITKFISNKLIIVFIIGILLHLIFEKLKIHNIFCKTRCI
jgi:hypothetical protein